MTIDDNNELEVYGNKQEINVEFLYQSNTPENTLEDLSTSPLASVRLRTAIAASAINDLNWNIVLLEGKVNKKIDLLLVGKVGPQLVNQWLTKIEIVKSYGGKIVIDYTDHHLDSNTPVGEFYRKAIKLANIVVCSSSKLKDYISNFTKVPTFVIHEPIEIPISKPVSKVNEITTILWFGHISNLKYLVESLYNNFKKINKARLILMTNTVPLPQDLLNEIESFELENLEIFVVPWTKKEMLKAAEISDFCIIPTGYKDETKKGASPNRLITSLSMGLPTLSDHLDSYLPFKKFFEVINSETIKSYIENPLANKQLILEAQEIISKEFSEQKIKADWINAFTQINSNMFKEKKPPPEVKLNLGCGDKIINGYINVDVVATRAGKQPDIICDLHNLSIFESNYADEILAVHVVEHFWHWEIIEILKEWTRVLKPGGKMILECPNLISAAEEFLKNPDIAALGGKEGQRSMWVFYGDPGWKDPLMIHRWGYTPRSLAFIMNEAGLSNLRQEPAQFKLREPRDMRITGIKK